VRIWPNVADPTISSATRPPHEAQLVEIDVGIATPIARVRRDDAQRGRWHEGCSRNVGVVIAE
jgi:hypothetical protein